MELNFGSNIISNTNGVLVIERKNQIQIEMGDKGQLLLTMNIYNAKGKQVALISRNKLVFNYNDDLTITAAPKSLNLIDTASEYCLIEITIADGDIVQILKGRFYTHRGNPVEITPDDYSVERVKVKHTIIDAGGKTFVVC